MKQLPVDLDLDNPEFQQAFQLLTQTNVNVFLTGKAGTGKSTFLKYICEKTDKNYIVLAPTGVAAVNVGGVTIHSFFQMPLRPVPPDDPDYSVKTFMTSNKLSRQKKKIMRELDLIIIDEVSMVRPDMIDYIDRVLRGVRRKRGVPFGGVQLLLVGDIFQLEAVVTAETRQILDRYYSDYFFFNAQAYNQVRLIAIELKKMYRQTDSKFIQLLDRVRVNSVTDDDLSLLNSKIESEEISESQDSEKFGMVLASRRDTVNSINTEKMALLEGEERIYEGEIENDFPEKILPTDLSLVLKVGAQVMLVRNDKEKRWVNGTLARIRELNDDFIKVELETGFEVNVEREIWDNISYKYDEKTKKVEEEVIGRFSQFPLKAAWALTIHKSQGLTFSNVTIDMGGGAFSAGQTYVALSRCRSLEGLHFINPLNRYDVIVSRGAAQYSKNFNDRQAAEAAMTEAEAERLSKEASDFFDNGEMKEAVETVWKIHNISGALAKKSVRGLIAKTLSAVRKLRSEVKELTDNTTKVSKKMSVVASTCYTKGYLEEASKLFELSLQLDKQNSEARLGMAKICREKGELKQAKLNLDNIIKKKDALFAEACILKGDILSEEDDVAGAAILYQNAAKKTKDNNEAILRLINLYKERGMEEIADQWRMWLDN